MKLIGAFLDTIQSELCKKDLGQFYPVDRLDTS